MRYLVTGPTRRLAALRVARDHHAELYRVEPSQYIGETEKNIAQLFEIAESKGWILFFDEADALFGKRTEVEDAHDRYANQEASYLLQRLEDYDGVLVVGAKHDDEELRRRLKLVRRRLMPLPPRAR